MVQLFPGCTYNNFNGTQKLITKGHACLIPTDKYFGKNVSDVATRIKTRLMTKNEGAVSLKTFNNYFKDKEKNNDIV